MEITAQELATLNFYRASELYGGLVLGHVVERARDPRLAVELARHSAEEIVHAQLWTETIIAVGGTTRPVRTTYQRRYAQAIGRPSTMLHVLAATQVFERRVYRHFLEHLRRPATHPAVKATLRRMIDEEKGHLSWVKRWLDEQALARPAEVRDVMKRYADADARVYESFLIDYGWYEPQAA
jgi:demethoxyubiquinone hydroxylase (CLK1/Coq7/Cat5 family)